ncbi:hypothetical protein ACI6PO_19280 [Agrobacterium tumefaciens]
MATSKWRTEGEGDDAGQAVKRTPLRSVANTALHTVNIGGQVFSTPSPYLMEILEAARREIEAENLRLSQPVANDQSSNDLPDRQKRLPQSVDKTGLRATTTPEKLRVDVKSFLTEFRNCEIDRDGFVSLKYVRVAPTYVPRVGSILSTLAVELERYGFSLNGEASRIGFSKDGTTLGLGVDAPRKRETQISKSGWKQFSHVHVGRFKLHIYGPADGIKKEWSDTDTKSIEDHFDKIVESFRINHVALREREEHARQAVARRAHMASRRKWQSNARSVKAIVLPFCKV